MESMERLKIMDFYKGKRVFVTGHTGFKGTWLCKMLINAGAIVTGYSLKPPTNPNLFELVSLQEKMTSIIADIRDYESLKHSFDNAKPEIVFHLAAQPIVRDSYKEPKYTYETNVMGTVNILECIRNSTCVKSVVNVTTDKVYRNNEWLWGYRENEILDGYDPYSNSKSCSELITRSYNECFLKQLDVAVSTVRAGNVIGGGDFANDRIVPDCVRAVVNKNIIQVRNPNSIRPYQHVLEPLFVYLLVAKKQYQDINFAGCYNVGPDDEDCITTGELVDLFCEIWGEGATWKSQMEKDAPHEANFLKLNCDKLKYTFSWKPRWKIEKCMEQVCSFSKVWMEEKDISKEMDREIKEFLGEEL